MATNAPPMVTKEDRSALEKRLWERQSRKCFICDEAIDPVLHQDQLEIDHIIPRADNGPDEENNYALVHRPCNREKSASDLRVARRMAEFDKLQRDATKRGERGANLGHVLGKYGGAKYALRLRVNDGFVEFTKSEMGDARIHTAPIFRDPLSGLDYFFTVLPLEYLQHDDRINPRSIGRNVRDLIDEFLRKRPQLHIALAWWEPDESGAGLVKVFDGQHKAAAQILLGVRELPVRIFVRPDTNVLLQANTNAGDKLRQVAFDTAVLRHLGSNLYAERVQQYQEHRGVTDYQFSEQDLVNFFRGEKREVVRYIIDAQRDAITRTRDNKLMELVEWSGKGSDRPLSYATIEGTFFKEFLYKQALATPIGEGLEQGENPRLLERQQLIHLMNLFAGIFFVGSWNPDIGGRRLENRLQKGENIPEAHLRAWRVAREEILANILAWVRLVIENYYAATGQPYQRERLLHRRLPEPLWRTIDRFLRRLADLPVWMDKALSTTVFGGKQNLDFWQQIFSTGKAPTGVRVLAKPLNLQHMIQESPAAT